MNVNAAVTPLGARSAITTSRWLQLCLGIVCMAMASNIQYGWTLFVNPIAAKHGWTLVAIQVAFTVMIVSQTWLMPVSGYLIDRFGPRPVVMASGAFIVASWFLNASADSLPMLYAAAFFGGLGMGGVVAASSGNLLKWFPDRRGLAAGLVALGFGLGSALFITPIVDMIKASGYEHAFVVFGGLFGVVTFVAGWFLRSPPSSRGAAGVANDVPLDTRRSYAPAQMLKTLPFWVLYASFVCVAAGGLMVIAQIAPMAKDMKIHDLPVTLLGVTLPALVFAMMIDRVLNGLTRPFFGWVSDQIGRENTMFVAFALEAVGIWALAKFGHEPLPFVLLTGFVFFAWGEIFSLFPATISDTFGPKYTATNVTLLLTAQGVAAFVVPLSGVVMRATGSWEAVFLIAAGMNAVAAILSLVVKPLRAKLLASR